METEALRFPIGLFKIPKEITEELIENSIEAIARFPNRLKSATKNLSDIQLDTPYREGGWSIRQVINHCADSHMNSIIRFKLALTEEKPMIKPYFEERWAELADSVSIPIQPAIAMLDGLHKRWEVLLKSLSPMQLKKIFIHPEHEHPFHLDEYICFNAWHCNHHLAHIVNLKTKMGW